MRAFHLQPQHQLWSLINTMESTDHLLHYLNLSISNLGFFFFLIFPASDFRLTPSKLHLPSSCFLCLFPSSFQQSTIGLTFKFPTSNRYTSTLNTSIQFI